MREFFKHLFTEVDNSTFDLMKVLAALSIITALGLTIYSTVFLHVIFDYQNFAVGTAALFAGVGVAFGMKKDTVG